MGATIVCVGCMLWQMLLFNCMEILLFIEILRFVVVGLLLFIAVVYLDQRRVCVTTRTKVTRVMYRGVCAGACWMK